MNAHADVVIIGGGVSGLSVALRLRDEGFEVLVLEKDETAGGTMKSHKADGWLIEQGPNSALETTPLFGEIFDRLGITSERVYASPLSKNRYILRDGWLHALPMSPGAFLKTSLWPASAKLRLLKEPFVGRADREESVSEFVERRLGREFLEYAINPFVAGVYAGDPDLLSVRAAFPKLYALEEKYGGLIRGMIGGRKERKKRAEKAKDRARMFSFRDGMQTFPAAIAAALGRGVRTHHVVREISRRQTDGKAGSFSIAYENRGVHGVVEAEAVVISTPAHTASRLVRPFSEPVAAMLGEISYPPVAEVFLGFRKEQVSRALDGFGFLVPAKERRSILGTIWSSSIFEGRAPEGHVAFTTFVGGTRQPELFGRSDRELVEIVVSELRSLVGAAGEPVHSSVIRWERAIPQYNLGYGTIMAALDRFEADHEGLFFCSNFRGGIAVGDCLMSSERTAKRVSGFLRTVAKRGANALPGVPNPSQ